MNSKVVRTEHETDKHGRRIPYDIFTVNHSVKTEEILPHTHTYFELTLVDEGVAIDHCGDSPLTVSRGDVFFVTPNSVHDLCEDLSHGRYRSSVVKFSSLFLYPLDATQSDIDSLFTPPCFEKPTYLFQKNSEEAQALTPIIQSIQRERAEKRIGYEMALRAKLTELYLWLVRELASDIPVSNMANVPISTDSTLKLKSALDYIEENYCYGISMQEVAEQVGMGYTHFSRSFQRMTGKRFNEYLSDIRLARAKKKLLIDGKTVSEVAAECGFDYLSYFIGKFKKAYGITPHDFQKKYRKKRGG